MAALLDTVDEEFGRMAEEGVEEAIRFEIISTCVKGMHFTLIVCLGYSVNIFHVAQLSDVSRNCQ